MRHSHRNLIQSNIAMPPACLPSGVAPGLSLLMSPPRLPGMIYDRRGDSAPDIAAGIAGCQSRF